MDRSERLRLFCALCLPDETLDRLAHWQSDELRRGRVVPRESLHITLAFLGSQPVAAVPEIAAALGAAAAGVGGLRFVLRAYRETRSVGMLTFDDEGGRAAGIAGALHTSLESLGLYRRDKRAWLPHVTVLRFREQPGLRPPLPELGEVSPSDAAVYSSVLRSVGSQYTILEEVPVGG